MTNLRGRETDTEGGKRGGAGWHRDRKRKRGRCMHGVGWGGDWGWGCCRQETDQWAAAGWNELGRAELLITVKY